MAHSSSHELPQLRQDSSVEPRAYRAARWPPVPFETPVSPPTTPGSTTSRNFSRIQTAPITRHLSTPSSSLPASYDSDQSPRNIPVLLNSGLSPSLRGTLPHPKPVRPSPFPMQSDLSAASTRAEQEPTALRDLRRVTAPPALLDPAYYQFNTPCPRRRDRRRHNHRQHDPIPNDFDQTSFPNLTDLKPPTPDFLHQSNRHSISHTEIKNVNINTRDRRFRKCRSASSLSDRSSDVVRRDRWSILSDSLRPRRSSVATRFSKMSLRGWFVPKEKAVPPTIPDRLCEVDLSPRPERQDTPLYSPVFRNERHPPDDPLPQAFRQELPKSRSAIPALLDTPTASDMNFVQPLTSASAITDQPTTSIPYPSGCTLYPLSASKLTDNGSNTDNLHCRVSPDLSRRDNNNNPFTGDDVNIGLANSRSTSIKGRHNQSNTGGRGTRGNQRVNLGRHSMDPGLNTPNGMRESISFMQSARQAWNSVRYINSGGESRRPGGSDFDDHEDSLMSALTNESDIAGTTRSRSMSEAMLHRRLSIVPTKDKMLSMWDRLVHRRKSNNVRGRHDCGPHAESIHRAPWLRFRPSEGV